MHEIKNNLHYLPANFLTNTHSRCQWTSDVVQYLLHHNWYFGKYYVDWTSYHYYVSINQELMMLSLIYPSLC